MIDEAGVGEGAPIKSGTVSAEAGVSTRVDFTTPFTSLPNVVLTPMVSAWIAYLLLVTQSYFKFQNNGTSGSRIFHWIATSAGNN